MPKKISIITLVNNPKLYSDCVLDSLKYERVEFIPVLYPLSATSGLNMGIKKSASELLVLCHQDVVFSINWIKKLHQQIELINDKDFGVLGTYGIDFAGSDGIGNIISGNKTLKHGSPPNKVMSLDEHCLIIRKSSNLFFDEDLLYFHMYGADICLQAYSKNMNCYAINNMLTHLSDNINYDNNFKLSVEWFINKWKNKSIFKKYRTTCLCPGVDL